MDRCGFYALLGWDVQKVSYEFTGWSALHAFMTSFDLPLTRHVPSICPKSYLVLRDQNEFGIRTAIMVVDRGVLHLAGWSLVVCSV
jgi:hypothetical protein